MTQPKATAYLMDRDGNVRETLPIYSNSPKKDVEAMNGTCRAYTDGKLRWTLESPLHKPTEGQQELYHA
ncbi:MAG: hypothetical protein ACYC9K_01040 [Sulfuricaulis sp.]